MAGDIKEFNDQNFEDAVKSGVVLIDFWAPWCGPCRMQVPILEEVVGEIGDKATIARVNVDEAPSIASRFGIQAIPTLVLLKDGEAQNKFVGVQQAGPLKNSIEKLA